MSESKIEIEKLMRRPDETFEFGLMILVPV